MAKYRYRVDIIESERGWGQKIDDTKFFDGEDEANTFCEKFNANNILDVVPDWYMRANPPVKVMVDN